MTGRPTTDGGVWGSYVEYLDRLERTVEELAKDRDGWRDDRNKLARDCADLRDAANTAAADERRRIADHFTAEGDVWRLKNNTEDECEYDWAAAMVRDGAGGDDL